MSLKFNSRRYIAGWSPWWFHLPGEWGVLARLGHITWTSFWQCCGFCLCDWWWHICSSKGAAFAVCWWGSTSRTDFIFLVHLINYDHFFPFYIFTNILCHLLIRTIFFSSVPFDSISSWTFLIYLYQAILIFSFPIIPFVLSVPGQG